MTERRFYKRDPDDFWDISDLVPQRPKRSDFTPVSRDTTTVEIRDTARGGERPYRVEDAVQTERYVTPPVAKAKEKPLCVFTPKESLLHEVRVYPWGARYDYYEAFRRQARVFLPREGSECPAVEFFSYMPQYSQMSAAQITYYFWWRTNFRKGRCLDADHSYLLLYLYELINVGDVMEPREVQALMTRLWLSYREAHPRLDALVREWLCDYSLLHGLPPPELPMKRARELIGGARLKEYYVPMSGGDEALTRAVLYFCNNYDYTKSKFFTPETAPDYHRVLRGALGVAIAYLRERDGNALTGGAGVSTISRDAFSGAICSYHLKRRIEVDYTSFSHTHELRYIMSDVLKYAENALRAARGVKSRLTVYAVEVSLRERLDAYLATAVPPKARAAAKKEEIPAYERRYDLPTNELSLSRAAEIEAASWQTTRRLVEAFEEETAVNGASFEEEKPQVEPPGETPVGLSARLGDLREFLRHAMATDVVAERAFAKKYGKMLDAVADEINEIAAEEWGDILLEETDGGFAVIEDYRERLLEEGVL